nr:MAG TPA: hypothetical protein [Caudoviricetes sp.]
MVFLRCLLIEQETNYMIDLGLLSFMFALFLLEQFVFLLCLL